MGKCLFNLCFSFWILEGGDVRKAGISKDRVVDHLQRLSQ